MANEQQNFKEVVYKFEKANGHRVIYVNGVWGNVNYPNEIRMDLFSDLVANPEETTHEVEAQSIGKEIKRSPALDTNTLTVIREIQVTAIMSPDVAEFIGNWLLTQVKQAKEQRK